MVKMFLMHQKKELCQQSGIDIGLANNILKYKDFGFGKEELEKD